MVRAYKTRGQTIATKKLQDYLEFLTRYFNLSKRPEKLQDLLAFIGQENRELFGSNPSIVLMNVRAITTDASEEVVQRLIRNLRAWKMPYGRTRFWPKNITSKEVILIGAEAAVAAFMVSYIKSGKFASKRRELEQKLHSGVGE